MQRPQLLQSETHDSFRQERWLVEDDKKASTCLATRVTNQPNGSVAKDLSAVNAFFILTLPVGLGELCCPFVQIPRVGAHFSLQGAARLHGLLACFGTWAVRRAKGAFLRLLRLLMIGRNRSSLHERSSFAVYMPVSPFHSRRFHRGIKTIRTRIVKIHKMLNVF